MFDSDAFDTNAFSSEAWWFDIEILFGGAFRVPARAAIELVALRETGFRIQRRMTIENVPKRVREEIAAGRPIKIRVLGRSRKWRV